MEGVGVTMAVCSSDDGRAAVMMAGWGRNNRGGGNVRRGARWQGRVPSNQKMVPSTYKDGHARPPYRQVQKNMGMRVRHNGHYKMKIMTKNYFERKGHSMQYIMCY